MNAEQAAWVREHAWTATMRKTFREVPGFYAACACQGHGPCINTPKRPETHLTCHVGRWPLPCYETIIAVRGGLGPAAFRMPYRYPAPSATGWKYSRLAMVWLADRVCRWACSCDCGHSRTDVAHAPERNPARPVTYDAVELPGFEQLITTASA